MFYQVYKLHFSTAVHFGRGLLSDSQITVKADTICSALCMEALQHGGEVSLSEFIELLRRGGIRFSDTFPFIGDTLYLPKPMVPFENRNNDMVVDTKLLKKIKYVPMERFQDFISGKADLRTFSDALHGFGKHHVRQQVAIRGREETEPYNIGVFHFNEDAGLYFIAKFKDENAQMILENYLDTLSFRGIGGKVSSGLGKFSFTIENLPEDIERRFSYDKTTLKMTISTSASVPEQLEDAVEGASYLLEKRTGFVQSEKFSATQKRKEDFYAFQSGSCFRNAFQGDVFDVSSGGAHPVYRYAFPFFMEVL